MKKLLLSLLFALPAFAVPVTPIVQPHMTFVSAVGAACAGCSLYTYAAGTTTPQATYTDSTGTSQNTNPIILGADGGANIWMGASAYKLVLIDTQGNTVFTVDNVTSGGGGGFVCGPASTIQIANSAVTGLTCDSTITINTTAHVINVGTLPTAHVSIGALGTPTSWQFDTTSAATALASLGGGTINSGTANQIAIYPSSGSTLGPSSAIPSGITGTTQSASDNSTKIATTAYVAAPGAINPTSVKVGSGTAMTGNQGNGTAVQHSTGTTSSGDCAQFDANGNTVDAGAACAPPVTQTNVTGSRSGGTVYQNTSTLPLYVSGNMTTSGSSVGNISCYDGPTSTPTLQVYSNEATATQASGAAGFSCLIPPGYYYEITVTGAVGSTPANWFETTF